jgi:predicted AlkP superfamily pyrophosphatase or phosphodiesterase
MRETMVLNIVGLTPRMISEHTPNLKRLVERGGMQPLQTVTPAVTCSVQTTFLTGLLPREHGIVANGWLFRDLFEIFFWRQSNRLVSGERVWETARRRDPSFTCANLFWWYNIAATADLGVTPRPMYPADGRKIPDCYATPQALRDELTNKFGRFPLFTFWGPGTDISSTQWIADCTLHVRNSRRPTLSLVYLPHLDYNLQRIGPDHPGMSKDLAEVDAVAGTLIEAAEADGARVIVLSEYGITPVSTPVHINRHLRDAGLLALRHELGREYLDPPQCRAFAVADHQIAHVYVANAEDVRRVKMLIERIDGVERVLDETGKAHMGLDHPRSGELIAISRADAWFTYYYWNDDACAPDYARTVEIHRKPGFDPVELFIDPRFRIPKAAVGWRLAKRKLGLRSLLDVIPLDASLVKGSHGRITDRAEDGPIFISSHEQLVPGGSVSALAVKQLILDHLDLGESG